MAEADLTAQCLRELLNYDPETGIFTRKVRTAQRHQVGDRADFVITGGNQKGYYRVGILSRRFLAHRLAWLYVHGEWPAQDVDHIDGDRGNNRIANLRDVPNQINRENMRGPRKDNKIGLLGVSRHGARWEARVQSSGKLVYREDFDTPEEAHSAYIVAKRQHHEGCSL